MKYKQRPGIVMTRICGDYYLIPTRSASEDVSCCVRLNLFSSIVWAAIGKEMPLERAYNTIHLISKQPEEQIREKAEKLMADFCEKGFLIETEGEE